MVFAGTLLAAVGAAEAKFYLPMPRPERAEPPKPAPGTRTEGPFNVVVLGDSLGDGLWAGLYRVFQGDERFNVIKHSKVASGFVRSEYYDWNKEVRRVLDEERVDIAVVIMGTNDRQVIVDQKGARHALRAKGWEAEYRRRVQRFTDDLQAAGAQIYWVGLPVMRSERFGGDMQYFNEIYRQEAASQGIPFVPTWNQLADGQGNYTAYGPDLRGRERLLRADDGIHFTLAGYQVLGSVVAEQIRHDVSKGFATAHAVPRPNEAQAEEEAPAKEEASETLKSAQAAPIEVPELRPGRADDWSWPLR